ncbi:MAG: ABC transporter ATP-binding protein [Treponema sp.]|jgi:oligopeptide/dipeptide ABC transporter ATP-binding protein|nr:ABC transporter ATP-binding protein [Treponema sp.]
MAYLLTVRDLRIEIKGRAAVEGISFSMEEGEILGIVGESGCGKSLTALSIPLLLPEPASIAGGSVLYRGRDLSLLNEGELKDLRGREISMVFQEPRSSLNPLIRVGRQITEPLELHGKGDRELNRRRALALMEDLGLREGEKLLDLYPHQLSGGMCQRVMIAAAMICGPRLLIADEPTTALDVSIQAQILGLLKKINRETGTAILFISHDLSVIRSLCGKVLVMYAGKLVERGPVEEVFSRPAHEYTRGLLGAIPGPASRGRPLANIPGRVPPIEEDRPPGCPFAPRCPRAAAPCRERFPPEADLGGGHSAACLAACDAARAAAGTPEDRR